MRKQHGILGCDEAETKRWVTALMRKLRALVIEVRPDTQFRSVF
jgi:hypothetical protein